MTTSTTKLIAVLAVSAGLLTTGTVLAKGSPGKSGGSSHSTSNGSNSKNSSTFNTFKLNTNSSNSSNHSTSVSGISKKPVTISQTFKKQDSNKDHKNSGLGISLNSVKKDNHSKDIFKKDNSKDFFCKKDHCKDFWWDWCYSKNSCYPYYFGCYYPTYSCYDYCLPSYTTCSYTVSLPVVENVQPARSLVSVGSILMINGQAFGNVAGGARLSLNGMALPIEVVEWTPAAVKVRMPQLEMGGVTPAEIEVFRGDGSLASKTPIDLTSSAGPLALGR
jgi:IPT/TIG domain